MEWTFFAKMYGSVVYRDTSSLVVMSREDLKKMTSALRDALAVAKGV